MRPSDRSDVCTLVAHSILADFGIFDVVFLTADLCDRDIPAGDLSIDLLNEIMPNNDQLMAIHVNGSDLRDAIEHGIDSYHFQGLAAAYPKIAGVRFRVKLKAPYGQRVKGVQVMNSHCSWKPLDETQNYRVLTTQSLAAGTHHYWSLTRSSVQLATKTRVKDAFWFFATSTCVLRDPFRQPKQVLQVGNRTRAAVA